jgi:predicted Rossmann fold nucleotide-binding protein DprA/Smf involved in DNA uptake
LATAIDRVKQDIQRRLSELETERDQLLRALEALTEGRSPVKRRGRPPKGSSGGSGNGRKRSGRRAPRGQRREQVLKILEGQELGPSAIAREMGVNPTQVSGLLRQLAAAGQVSRTAGGKWRLAAAAEHESPGGAPAPQHEAGGDESASAW